MFLGRGFSYPIALEGALKLKELAIRLPPDLSNEAPEMLRYQQLIKEGKSLILASQQCWDEFGMEEFYRALRLSWQWQAFGNNGWTFKEYIFLIDQYKNKITREELEVPLIVLGRQNTKENHILKWINFESLSKRLV